MEIQNPQMMVEPSSRALKRLVRLDGIDHHPLWILSLRAYPACRRFTINNRVTTWRRVVDGVNREAG